MKANANSKARSHRTAGILIGTLLFSTVIAACKGGDDGGGEKNSDEGIGLTRLDPVANSAEAAMPVDATPSPDGAQIYFIAYSFRAGPDGIGKEQIPAIYKVSAAGGAAPSKLFEGEPLATPFGITISDDGQTLFIADSSADQDTSVDGAERSLGRVFTMSANGSSPSALSGTENIMPAGVEARSDTLYITGRKDGASGLFKTPIVGGMVTSVATGAPFVDPGGVAVARNGDAYVVDTGSATSAQALASVVKITPDGRAEVILEGISVGHPAGIALVNDESAVLVSALDNAEGTDRVYRLQLADRSVRKLGTKIGEFYESAGLHRARNVEVFAWADSHANGTGTVYALRP